jgi:hypothetical protein
VLNSEQKRVGKHCSGTQVGYVQVLLRNSAGQIGARIVARAAKKTQAMISKPREELLD